MAARDVWMKFFPSDWRGDESLQLCSLAARGCWAELICLAHKHGGYVLVNGVAPDTATLARAIRSTPAETKRLLDELRQQGVYSTTEQGVIYSRRMVRDAKTRSTNQENGAKGGNPYLKKSDNRSDNPPDNRRSNRPVDGSDKAQKLEPEPTLEPEPDTSPAAPVGASAFDRFWARYPRKAARKAAAAEWKRQRLDDRLEAVLAGLDRALASRVWREAMAEPEMPHVPHARTWLHQGRWQEEATVAVAAVPAAPGRVSPDLLDLCRSAGINHHNTLTWFREAVITAADDGVITLVITDEVARTFVIKHFAEALEAAVIRRGGVRLVIADRRAA